MDNRIKGITVEIGGDTTGLDKALKCMVAKYYCVLIIITRYTIGITDNWFIALLNNLISAALLRFF